MVYKGKTYTRAIEVMVKLYSKDQIRFWFWMTWLMMALFFGMAILYWDLWFNYCN